VHNTLLYIVWDPNPDFITLGNFSIKWYGIMWGASLFACFFLGRYVWRKAGKDEEKLTILIQYIFICGIIGARLAHIVFYNLDYYMAHPADLIAVWKGGLASHGGVVGGLLGLYLFCKRHKEYGFFWTVDHGIITVASLAALMRVGNLMNSELYGKAAAVPWAFIFTQVDNVPRHPVVLYESIAYFLIQIFMLLLYNKYKESKPGIYISCFLILIFSVRFLLEFMKEPDGEMLFHAISKTQALNLPFIISGLILAYFVAGNKLNYRNTPTV
jgi:phosphatidylglycerol:prolipoprotein diacylglycerol transferase